MEVWKDIPGYMGRYQVSNFGRIKSLSRWKIMPIWNKKYRTKEKIRSPFRGTYDKIFLYKGVVGKSFQIHKLVASLFIPNPRNKPCINHKDGDKHNNNADNLEWCTHSENTQHAYDTNLMPDFINMGVENGRSKLNTKEVLIIRESYRHMLGLKYHKLLDLADIFNVSRTTISRIISKTHWKIEV